MKKIFFIIYLALVLAVSKECNTATAESSNFVTAGIANTNPPVTTTTSSAPRITANQHSENAQEKDGLGLKLSVPIWSAFWVAIWAFLNSMIGPRIKRWNLTRQLEVYSEKNHGKQFRCRVRNGGYWTVKNAIIYITLPFGCDDTREPPPGHDAIIRPDNFVPLIEDQLCWSVRAPTINPIKIDIYAKEPQPFSPCAFTNPEDMIMIPSEEGWPRFKDDPLKMRVFLRRKQYIGHLKVVSEDTNAIYFKITINPDGLTPIEIQKSSKKEYKKMIASLNS
jgi:hypothetical protein